VCEYDFVFSAGFHGIIGAVKHHSPWHEKLIYEAIIPLKVTATFNIPNYTPLHSKSPNEMIICSLREYCSRTMLTKGSPTKTTIMAPTGGVFGSQQRQDGNVVASDNNAGNTLTKDTQFGQPTGQIHHPLGYSYPPSQPPFPGTPQFYHHVPGNMSPSSHPITVATQGYASYGPTWQASDFPLEGYGGLQMFPHQQLTEDGPLSPGLPRVPPAPPGNNPVIHPTSSSSTAQGQLPGTLGDPPLASQRNNFSWLQTCEGQMLQGMSMCPNYQRYPMTTTALIITATIRQTWVVPKAKQQSAWTKRNSSWSNLLKNGVAQLQCLQPVEESMGVCVSREKASVH